MNTYINRLDGTQLNQFQYNVLSETQKENYYSVEETVKTTTVPKLENGQFDLLENFEYRGVEFTCKSWGKGSTSHSTHIVNGIINGVPRSFTSTTRKQAKDMFKKAVRKSELIKD